VGGCGWGGGLLGGGFLGSGGGVFVLFKKEKVSQSIGDKGQSTSNLVFYGIKERVRQEGIGIVKSLFFFLFPTTHVGARNERSLN